MYEKLPFVYTTGSSSSSSRISKNFRLTSFRRFVVMLFHRFVVSLIRRYGETAKRGCCAFIPVTTPISACEFRP